MTAPPGGVPRVRFAPSPTGALHLGNLRTALFNWLDARSQGGAFVLRIEDTDQGRHIPGSEARILESLRWLGLDWDEGPEAGGPHQPYVQSLRLAGYRQAGEALLAGEHAYWCTCTPERLTAMRREQERAHRPTRYDRRCLGRADEVAAERAAGAAAVLRLRMPEGRTSWVDLIRGEIAFDNDEIDDQVLLKSDGFPTYHLAVVVDDHEMEISTVIRGEDWIPSTPKHLAAFAALGWEPPRFAHVPNVLAEDRAKLSKRRGAPDVLDYRDRGYLPEAVVNAMALLGWSSGTEREVFTPEELAREFRLERVHPAPAVHDPRRLDALNGLHIRRLGDAELAARLVPWVPGADEVTLGALAPLLRERLRTLADAADLVAPLLGEPALAPDLEWPPRKVDAATAAALLDAAVAEVEGGGLDAADAMRERLTALVEERGSRARDAFRVLYIAAYGRPVGLPVFDGMRCLGAAEAARRLRSARARLPG